MTHSTADAHHASASQPPADPRRWLMLVLLCLAQFMLILDVTVVNVALPDMATDLDLGRQALTWVVTSYTLCFGGLMLLGGRLADVFGAHRTVLAGIAVSAAASPGHRARHGRAHAAGRADVPGRRSRPALPAALSLVTTGFHGAERNKALGVWAAVGGAGSAIGVLLGGALTDGPGWQWVFYINVPVGVLALTALPGLLPARPPRPARLDLPGALLVTAGTGSLIYGLVKAGDTGWSGAAALLLSLLAAVVLYGAFAGGRSGRRRPADGPPHARPPSRGRRGVPVADRHRAADRVLLPGLGLPAARTRLQPRSGPASCSCPWPSPPPPAPTSGPGSSAGSAAGRRPWQAW